MHWIPIAQAPKDGTTVILQVRIPNGVRAYWDRELKTWVLARPLHLESIRDPAFFQYESGDPRNEKAAKWNARPPCST
jgi:hypothetical protein